ncbi:hypothetical protein VTJ83DRAFT_1771 [Remersonia thermophila]|uniref:Uncharacterized protein n=1 Tax=Remersonia thermophila TaxID=72144 RepID=A0ABR4DGU7_9PEZI
MFGSRRHHRAPNPLSPLSLNSPAAGTASPNADAATAAAAVFRRHDSSSSLSVASAAAAAALRARPTTPINVANVQTKRTLRRSASVASSATGGSDSHVSLQLGGGRGSGGLRRRGSSGSMSERTFRTPSPHRGRPGTAASAPAGMPRRSFSGSDMPPPVPPIPVGVDAQQNQNPGPGSGSGSSRPPKSGHNSTTTNSSRSSSSSSNNNNNNNNNNGFPASGMNHPPVRLASQKLASGDASSWFAGARVGDLSTIRRSDSVLVSPPSSPRPLRKQRHSQRHSLPSVVAADSGVSVPASPTRPDSQSSSMSINFSYPKRVRSASSAAAAAAAAAATTDGTSQPVGGADRGAAGVSPGNQQPLQTQTQTQTQANAEKRGRQFPLAAPPKKQPSGEHAEILANAASTVVTTVSTKRHSAPATTVSPSGQTLVYDPNSRRMVLQADLLAMERMQAAMMSGAQPQPQLQLQVQPQPELDPEPQHLKSSTRRSKRGSKKARPSGSHLAAGAAHQTAERGQESASSLGGAQHQVVPTLAGSAPSPVLSQRLVEMGLAQNTAQRHQVEPEQSHPQHAVQQGQAPPASAYMPATATMSVLEIGLAVRRQPSVVPEVSEPETDDDKPKPKPQRTAPAADVAALDAVPPQGPQPPVIQQIPATPENQHHHPRLSTDRVLPDTSSPHSKPLDFDIPDGRAPASAEPSDRSRAAHVSRERTHSNSPARQAHFGPVQQTLTVKHSPPPRSVSPRKSALKHHASPSSSSPVVGDNASEASASGNSQDHQPAQRKKSARVSFYEDLETGDGLPGDSSAAAGDPWSAADNGSPSQHGAPHHHRHSWLSNLTRGRGRGWHKSDGGGGDHDGDDDDDGFVAMTPRPALPSFGSVRDRKPRDPSPERIVERPLVRPKVGDVRYESARPQAHTETAAGATPTAADLLPSPPLGVSSDHAVGAVLSSAATALDGDGKLGGDAEGGIWDGEPSGGVSLRQHDEPLPPIVTSVEGSGYFSDSSDTTSLLSSVFEPQQEGGASLASTSTGTEAKGEAPPSLDLSNPPASGSVEDADDTASIGDAMSTAAEDIGGAPLEPQIPSISVSLPMPIGTEEELTFGDALPDVPGGFPEDELDPPFVSTSTTTAVDVSQDKSQAAPAATTTTTTTTRPDPPAEQDDASSDSSSEIEVWSDAYEDLSEVESGGGFLSLNAVVETESPPRRVIAATAQVLGTTVAEVTRDEPRREDTARQPQSQREKEKAPEPAPVAPPTQTQPQTHSQTQARAQPQTQPQIQPQAQTQPQTQPRAQPQAQIQPQTQPRTRPQTQPQTVQVDWEQAKAFWRSLSAEKRAQLQREALEEAGIEADRDEPEPEPESVQKPRKKKSIERRNSERRALAARIEQQMQEEEQQRQQQQQQQQQEQEQRRQQEQQPHKLRRSKRVKEAAVEDSELDAPLPMTGQAQRSADAAEPAGVVAPSMRKTMRRSEPEQQVAAPAAPAEGTKLRKSMRSGDPDRKSRERPISAPPVSLATQAGHSGWALTQPQGIPEDSTPVRPRRGSTGSESSFKRFRLSKGQGFGFRQSLRPTPRSSVQEDERPIKRLSLRSASPSSTASPLASGNSSIHMRTTLRDMQPPSPRSSGGLRMPRFGLRKKSKQNQRSRSKSSRFADSSDEDGDASAFSSGFRSRFEDSSDDEAVPVPPIPAIVTAPPLTPSVPAPTASAAELNHHHQQRLHRLRHDSSVASTALPEELEESEDPVDRTKAASTTEAKQPPKPLPPTIGTTHPAALRRIRSGRGSLLPVTSNTSTAATTMATTTTAATTAAPTSSQSASAPQPGLITTLLQEDASPPRRTSRRGSFLSALRPRRHRGGIGRGEVSESPARRDTKLERSAGELRRIRSIRDGDLDDDQEGPDGDGDKAAGMESPRSTGSPTKSLKLNKRGRGTLAKRGLEAGLAIPTNNNTLPIETEADKSNVQPKASSQPEHSKPGTTGLDIAHDNDDGGRVYDTDNSPLPSPARPPRRVATAGSTNLGTRTLSSGSGHGFLHLHMKKNLGFSLRRSSTSIPQPPPQQQQQQQEHQQQTQTARSGTVDPAASTTAVPNPATSISGSETGAVPASPTTLQQPSGGTATATPTTKTAAAVAPATATAAAADVTSVNNMSVDGSVAGTGATAATASTGKKKRFGSLRKMFGMGA